MSGFLGMVPAEVLDLASQFEHGADEIDALVSEVTRALGGTSWVGEDRSAFEAHWSGDLTRALQDLSTMLRDTGRIARSNADQQTQASS